MMPAERLPRALFRRLVGRLFGEARRSFEPSAREVHRWPVVVMAAVVLTIVLTIFSPNFGVGQTAVQLPTVSRFGVATTVEVPDRGSMALGSVDRAAGSTVRHAVPILGGRPTFNRASGSVLNAGTTRVTVCVHDFDAMEAELLAGLPMGRGVGGSLGGHQQTAQASVLREKMLTVSRVPVGASWLPNNDQRTGPALQRGSTSISTTAEAEHLWERGEIARQEGRLNVARIYYQMVSRRTDPALRERALARLKELDVRSDELAAKAGPRRLP